MAVFQYKALDHRGRQTRGLVDAESARLARQKLKQQGIFPTSLEETTEKQRGNSLSFLPRKNSKIDTEQLSIATRQLATLIGAGMPLVEALRALGEQIDSARFRGVVAEVGDQVNEGSTLAAAMRAYPGVFPRLYINMVAAAEMSGSLDLVLSRLAELLESQTALKRKVKSALTYPILMLCLCLGVILLLLTYVVPQITAIFQDRNAILPFPTRVIVSVSDFLQSYWFLVIGFLVLVALWFQYYRETPKGRKTLDTLAIRVPVIGNLTLKVATARFAKNLGMMLASGVELLSALEITRAILGNSILEKAVETATYGVNEGENLSKELERQAVFPRLLIHMIAIGERTGQMEAMLLKAADAFESEVTAAISSFTSILEPVLILFLAVVVGGILAAVMLPMLEMTNLSGL